METKMKYPRLDMGTMEAIVNKLGGMDGVDRFLRNELVVQPQVKVQVIANNYTIDLDAPPMIPSGWSVAKNSDGTPCHTKGGKVQFRPDMVDLYFSDEQKVGGLIRGNKLRQLLKGKNPYNANLLDFYLAHLELIPESWKGKSVFFWGTIYRDADGNLYVRCLFWHGDGWSWGCRWLSYYWGSCSPAAVRGK